MNNNLPTDIRLIWFDPSDPKWTMHCSINRSFEDISCLYKVWNKHLPSKNKFSFAHLIFTFLYWTKKLKQQKYLQRFAGSKVAKALLMISYMKIGRYNNFLKFYLDIIIANSAQQHNRDEKLSSQRAASREKLLLLTVP